MIYPEPVLITRSGQPVHFDDPSRTIVKADDLFYALSRQRRYGGHVDFTVLQHTALCVYVARAHPLADPSVAGYLAAHDLHEAYIQDVPYQLKPMLKGYREMEARWEAHIHAQLRMPWPPPEEVARAAGIIDRRVCAVECTLDRHPHADHYVRHNAGEIADFEWRGADAFYAEYPKLGNLGLWERVVVPAIRAVSPAALT